jgi:hypothetical protein
MDLTNSYKKSLVQSGIVEDAFNLIIRAWYSGHALKLGKLHTSFDFGRVHA